MHIPTHTYIYTCVHTHTSIHAHTHTHTESNSMVLSFILRFTVQEFNSKLKIHVQLDLNTGYINMATSIQLHLLFRNKLCITNGIIQERFSHSSYSTNCPIINHSKDRKRGKQM